ncbi:uncharacterized protein [Miscanthus floridulus]|uniref:uncharacterized protein n=1 Tax=Miscanthus floridulus TaxID=154761 RepID=UPI003458210C
MGLCLSVALWKEKLYGADCCSRSVRGRVVHKVVAGVESGDCEYGILGGDTDDVQVEQKAAAVAPVAGMGVKSGGVEGAAAAVSGGTPVRPIWQRRVLMGVKCQLPRFSGMILYDESGRPVCSGIRDRARDQEKHAAAISVLTDLL